MKSYEKIRETIIYALRHREGESERVKGARYALQWAIDYFTVDPKDNEAAFKKIFESEDNNAK